MNPTLFFCGFEIEFGDVRNLQLFTKISKYAQGFLKKKINFRSLAFQKRRTSFKQPSEGNYEGHYEFVNLRDMCWIWSGKCGFRTHLFMSSLHVQFTYLPKQD